EESADVDREALLAAVLGEFEELYTVWVASGGDAEASGLASIYRDLCVTIGRRVRVHLPGDKTMSGTATGVDTQARLLVRGPGGVRALSVGDVVHVRPGDCKDGFFRPQTDITTLHRLFALCHDHRYGYSGPLPCR